MGHHRSMTVWIDTHCHLDAPEFDPDRDSVRAQARAEGLELTDEHWQLIRFLREELGGLADMVPGLNGENGVVAAMKSGGVIIACATISPAEAKRFAARVEEAGLLYVDGPISGGSKKAEAGQLTFMASGSSAAFAAARPALDAMAGTVYELGDQPGIGSSFKIVNQLLEAGSETAARPYFLRILKDREQARAVVHFQPDWFERMVDS